MANGDINQWLQRARDFLSEHEGNPDAMYYTVRFLVERGCGINRRVRENDIVEHLSLHGFNLTIPEFQETVLDELKRSGIVATLVYPGPPGGVFIPSCEEDIERAVRQVMHRVVAEVHNCRGLVNGTRFDDTLEEVEGYLSHIEGQFNER
jgi:hypothetical protein